MPFDALSMSAVADEVQTAAAGGRIQRILQPSAASVALAVYASGRQNWIALSADARYARVYLANTKLAKAFSHPSGFVMQLRKHLEGARVLNVSAIPGERILTVTCRSSSDIRLIAECMGRHSNIMLLDADDTVLGAMKVVTARQSRVRPIAPGVPYRFPPKQSRDRVLYPDGDRVDPHLTPDAFEALLSQVQPAVPVRTALLGLLSGANPFLVDQIIRRAGNVPHQGMNGVEIEILSASARQLFSLYETRQWEPCTFEDERGRPDSAPYLPIGLKSVEPAPSMSAALEASVGERESHDAHSSARRELLDRVERRQHQVDRRIASLQSGLDAAADAEQVMMQGQLLLAYGYGIEPGDTALTIPDLGVTIRLDSRLSASENAERLFKRYRKLRDARARIPELRRVAQLEASRLRDVAIFARLADSEAAIAEVARELGGQTDAPSEDKRKRGRAKGPASYRFKTLTALVGRNARENELITFKLARRDDTWMHARERTGAHVVLQGAESPSEEDLLAAAQLAAYFSEGRDDSAVDVDVTKIRNVRKLAPGPPGRVTYSHARTIRVKPAREPWQSIRRRH